MQTGYICIYKLYRINKKYKGIYITDSFKTNSCSDDFTMFV